MARLTAAQRRRLPARVFGLPKQRKYPINDRGHAIAAKGRATEGLRRGWINTAEYKKIVRKADKKIASTRVKRKVGGAKRRKPVRRAKVGRRRPRASLR